MAAEPGSLLRKPQNLESAGGDGCSPCRLLELPRSLWPRPAPQAPPSDPTPAAPPCRADRSGRKEAGPGPPGPAPSPALRPERPQEAEEGRRSLPASCILAVSAARRQDPPRSWILALAGGRPIRTSSQRPPVSVAWSKKRGHFTFPCLPSQTLLHQRAQGRPLLKWPSVFLRAHAGPKLP